MLKLLSAFFIFLTSALFATNKGESVVCIHGFMGASWNMRFIEKNLKKDNWDAVTWQYASRDHFIEEHGEQLVHYLTGLAHKKPGRPIHFVTHSMGGLVLLAALNHPLCPHEAKIGKVILLAPPAKGSHWGRWLSQFTFAKHIAKNFSGQELMTHSQFDHLGKYPYSLQRIVVIAGSLGCNPLLKGTMNDGTLSVEETFLSTPHEHIIIRCGHKSIIFSKKTCRLIRQFLKAES